MIKIGIANNSELIFTKDMLVTLMNLVNLKVNVIELDDYIDEKDTLNYKDVDILILMINENSKLTDESFNILVLNAESNYVHQNKLIKSMRSEDCLIVDSDNKQLMKSIKMEKGYLITCGFNPKSSITTSSVTENECKTVQVCIQRSFKTINNREINQQEFSIDVKGAHNSIFSILAGVGTILICGIKIEDIS